MKPTLEELFKERDSIVIDCLLDYFPLVGAARAAVDGYCTPKTFLFWYNVAWVVAYGVAMSR